MKQIFTLTFMLATCWGLQAQKNVILNLSHFLGAESFGTNVPGENDLGETYKIDRLEYYVSQISITHDGGQITPVEDYWILVNTNGVSSFDLGSFEVTDVETISFYIGIEEDLNHADPTLWGAQHPLGPKSPSMHWGWAGGYRFIALEGNGGPNFNNNFELHCLGDDNYFQINIDVVPEIAGDEINLYVNADYNEGLKGLGVNSGVVSHGTPESVVCIANFRDYVFSSGMSTGIFDVENTLEVSVSPNPSHDGVINIALEDNGRTHQIQVYDLSGKLVQQSKTSATITQLNILDKGIYLLNIIDEKGNQATKRVIVQ